MELNETNLKKIRWLVVFTVAAVVVGVNYRSVFALLVKLFGLSFPFLLGGVLAFILNVPMRRIEKLLFPNKKNKLTRPVSLMITLFILAGVLLFGVFVVMPQLVETFKSLQKSIPVFLEGVRSMAESVFAENPDILQSIQAIQVDWQSVLREIAGFLSSGAGSVLSSTLSAAMSIVNGVVNFGIGFVFAIYILLSKETLGRQFKKLMYACMPGRVTDSALRILKLTSDTFSHFLAGQCIEAIILGSMFFVILTVLRLPYALLIGVLIAFTALIPIFGAFIGCAVGVFLMLMVKPVDALLFVIIFFALQQIEGNLIYPHVVGNSVGLPSIWVLVAVTIGGSAMGIVGMLIFIPLSSVVYSLVRGFVNTKLADKRTGREKGKRGVSGGGKDPAAEEKQPAGSRKALTAGEKQPSAGGKSAAGDSK